MVALDDAGARRPVPSLDCTDDAERRREREAQVRRANRLAEREQLVTERGAE